MEGEKGRINQGLRLSARLGKAAVIKLAGLWMWVNQINTCLLAVSRLRGKVTACKFQMCCYSSCGPAGMPNTLPFPLFAFCFATLHCSCFFHFSDCALLDVPALGSVALPSQSLHSHFSVLMQAVWVAQTQGWIVLESSTNSSVSSLTRCFLSRDVSSLGHCLICSTHWAMLSVVTWSGFGRECSWGNGVTLLLSALVSLVESCENEAELSELWGN